MLNDRDPAARLLLYAELPGVRVGASSRARV
jgi:hypothetical protein